jgi:hypothetical protein
MRTEIFLQVKDQRAIIFTVNNCLEWNDVILGRGDDELIE